MSIDADIVALLAVVALALVVVLAGFVTILALRLRLVRRTQRRVFGRGEQDLVSLLEQHGAQIRELWDADRRTQTALETLADHQRDAISRVAVLRYDAFDDMGGALSFSAALLDERGNGMVISAINGRSETRSYAKMITAGTSTVDLTGEEAEAVEAAIEGRTATTVPPTRRRRRRAS
jgi:hypothetical protein